VGIAFTGGARHKEPSAWELGNSITLIEFAVCKNDVEITSCYVFGPDKQCFCQSTPLQESRVPIRDGPQKNEKRANLALSFYTTGIIF